MHILTLNNRPMMKKIFSILALIFFCQLSFSQISTTKIVEKKEVISTEKYDSLNNFLRKDVFKYIGQELYLSGKSETLREYGYSGFSLDYTKNSLTNKSNVYKCCDGYNSKYNELAGKYFTVLSVIKHPKANESEFLYGSKFYLLLLEKESKDSVYFEYDGKFEHSFPFIVIGFYEKQKKLLIGQEFVFTDRTLKVSCGGGSDIQTGKPLTIITGEKWKCTDLTVEERYFNLALVVVNSTGEKTTVSYNSTFDERKFAYTSHQADNYKKKFGDEVFNMILKGNVRIGMTKEMCKLSWGEPKSINETITSGGKSEQWVYSDNYLYFDNGILTTIQ